MRNPADETDTAPLSRRKVLGMGALGLGALASQWGAAQNSSNKRTLSFIAVNDLHGQMVPRLDLARDPSTNTAIAVERGGLARAAGLIKRIRAENPFNLLMDLGDAYHGSVEALYTNGNALVGPMNALGFDVGILGNWDFAYGPDVTRLRYASMSATARFALGLVSAGRGQGQEIERVGYPVIAANITATMGPVQGQSFLPATLIRDIGGVKVGLIGLASDMVEEMHPMLAAGLEFVQGEAAYKELIDHHAAKLRAQGAQVVAVLSHLGIHKDYRLAQIVQPGVDVFFSSHTHEASFEPLVAKSGALVVEPGNDGYLGRMDLSVSEGRVVGYRWRLYPITPDTPEDALIKAQVEAARAPFLVSDPGLALSPVMGQQTLNQPINTVIGRSAGVLHRRGALENPFNDTFADLLRDYAGTELALTPGFRFDAVVQREITLEDVYRYFPVAYTVAAAKITGRRLKEILETRLTKTFSTQVFQQAGGWMDGLGGLEASLDLAAPDGARVKQMRLMKSGEIILPERLLTIAGCRRPMDAADVLCSYSGFSGLTPINNPATGQAFSVIDLFANHLARITILPSSSKRFIDLHQTPLWPKTPFIQPLEGVGLASNHAQG